MSLNEPRGAIRRREFLADLALAGVMLCGHIFWPRRILAQTPAPAPTPAGTPPAFQYKYRTFSVRHFPEIKEWMEKLIADHRVSTHPTFREYISGFKYDLPEAMPAAKSIVMVAYRLRLSSVAFHQNGKKYVLLIPTGYADDGVPSDLVRETIARDVLGDPKGKLIGAPIPAKTSAVRCGLAEYGLNNITFVPDYGSFHQLVPFFCEQELEDHWGPLKTMRICKGCSICTKACPTKAIREQEFVIDVGRCLTLYNELPDALPEWLDPSIHHTLVGCLRCQATCPANLALMNEVTPIAELTEEETLLLVNGERNPSLEEAIIAKLAWFPAAKDIPYFARNTRLALANAVPV
jgi:epoxyqueuosine reductase